MKNLKIVIFNAPPRAGKDTHCNFLFDLLEQSNITCLRYSFAAPLQTMASAIFDYDLISVPDEEKDVVIPEIGMSKRSAMIFTSEEVIKPKFGKDFFGQLAIRNIKNFVEGKGSKQYSLNVPVIRSFEGSSDQQVIVISDCGFIEEVEVLIEAFGIESLLLVKLSREGKTYLGDSRSEVFIEGVQELHLQNDGSLEEAKINCERLLKEIVH